MNHCLINGYLVHLIEDLVFVNEEGIVHVRELVPKQCEDGTWALEKINRAVQLDPIKLEGAPIEVLSYLIKSTGKTLTVEAKELFRDMLVLKSTLKKGTLWPKSTAQRFFGKHLRTVVALGLLKKQGDGYGFFFI